MRVCMYVCQINARIPRPILRKSGLFFIFKAFNTIYSRGRLSVKSKLYANDPIAMVSDLVFSFTKCSYPRSSKDHKLSTKANFLFTERYCFIHTKNI